LNFELFIAKRIIAGKEHKNSISSPIIKIAILAIALGMVIMMISVATSVGLQQKIRDKMSGFKGHIQITSYDNNFSDVSVIPIDKNQDFYPKFSNIDGIKNVQVFASKTGLIRTKSDFEGVVFKGISTDYNWDFFKEYIIEGRLPNYNQERNKEILLSKKMVSALQLKLNQTILVSFLKSDNKLPSSRKYKIVGIYNTGFLEFDKNMMIGDIREIQRLNGWSKDQVGGFEVLLDNFDELQEKSNEIYSSIGSQLDANSIVQSYPALFEWLSLFDNNTWFIMAIMIIVASINMITALLVLILERAQMVGVLKALGSANWQIRKIFIYNAAYLILKGLFWGNIIGLLIIGLQSYFGILKLDPESYYVSTLPVSLNVFPLILLNLGTLFFCFLMMIVPSLIVTKIHPSKTIRFA